MAGMREPLGQYESSGTVKIGPFLSSTDGKTPLIDLDITQSDVQLSKNNGGFNQKDDTDSAVHDKNGWYDIPLNENDISDDGILLIAVELENTLPVWRKFAVSVQEPEEEMNLFTNNLMNDFQADSEVE